MIGRKLKNLLVLLLKHDIVVTSWGVTDIKISESRISFQVSGFRYQGIVEINAPTDSNDYLIHFSHNPPVRCDLESVIELLDDRIEKSDTCYQELQTRLCK